MAILKKLGIRVLIFSTISIFGILIWIGIGIERDETLVAGASWLEYALGLSSIFIIAAIIIESVAKNNASRLIFDLVAIFAGIFTLIKFCGFKIVFAMSKETLKSSLITIGVIVGIAIIISLPEIKKLKNEKD